MVFPHNKGVNCTLYLDGGIQAHQAEELLRQQLNVTLLGWLINYQRSDLQPS